MGRGDALAVVHEESWLVRVLDGTGATVGTGFLIGGSTVLTCAHVISRAIRTGHRGRPRDYVSLDLPALQQQRQAEVVPGGWFPGDPDLAVLAVHGPVVRGGASLARARYHEAAAASSVRWQLPAADWTEKAGYSGMPCLNGDATEVVGMLTGGTAGSPESSWPMLPASTIMSYWPPAADPVALAAGTSARPGGVGLSLRDIGAVIEAMLEFPDFLDPRLRSLYIDLTAERTGAVPDLERHTGTRRDLWSLAAWCARVFGGFSELLEVIQEFHPASVEVDALVERIERAAPAPLLTYQERADLEVLVRTAPQPDVIECAAAVMEWPPAVAEDTPGDGPGLVRLLEDSVTSREKAPRVAEFAALLGASQHGALRGRLFNWAETITSRLGTPGPGRESAWRAPVTDAPRRYLTFKVSEDLFSPGRYLLTAWSEHRGQPRDVLHMREEPLPIKDVEAEVERLIQQTAVLAPGWSGNLLVEFVLPDSLLNLPVDQWRTRPEPDAPLIGESSPVVVRSLEHPPDPLRLLQTPWQARLSDILPAAPLRIVRPPALDIVHVPSRDIARREREWSRELARIADDGVPYLENADSRQLRTAVRAGIAVMLWSRKPDDRRTGAWLMRRLAEASLWELPVLIMRLRQEAADSGTSDHAGHHLGLLWDDPARRVQAESFLTAPMSAGDE
jgi:vWA-MoxR associated protein C-terminal domain/Effector-associated domain 2